MPKISVIIPCYNAKDYITETINSVQNQTFKDFEIICVNDGSKDDTQNIIEELVKRDDRIKLINQSNAGVCVARNVGIENAKGDFLSFLDQDDLLDPIALQTMHDNIKECDICVCKIQDFVNLSDINAVSQFNVSYYTKNWNYKRILKQIISMGTNKLYKKKILADVRWPEGIQPGEDDIFVFRVLNKIKNYAFVDAELYKYRIHPNQTMKSSDEILIPKKQKAALAYSKELMRYAKTPKLNWLIKRFCERKANRMLYRAFASKVRHCSLEDKKRYLDILKEEQIKGNFNPYKLRPNEQIDLLLLRKKYG